MLRPQVRTVVAFVCITAASPLRAQLPASHLLRDASARPPAGSVSIVAGVQYRAGPVRRFLIGDLNRDLWTSPMHVALFHPSTFAGGLTPTKEGGGNQTRSLRFATKDGDEFVFRSTEKRIEIVPDMFKGTPAMAIFRDAVSALNPAGPLLAAPILAAAGVLHPSPQLIVIADDTALGYFRGKYAGRLGTVEEYPVVPDGKRGFAGATDIIESTDLQKLLDTNPRTRVNADAFLAARLADFLMNDNDRHAGNWKWAMVPAHPGEWQPIARDRDHAFVAYDGFLISLARLASPLLVPFDDRIHLKGLTVTRDFDARILAAIEKPRWDSITDAFIAHMTDAVLDSAMAAMPPEYRARAPELPQLLRARRAAMKSASNAFYALLARRVNVHATDDADRAHITRLEDGSVVVELSANGVRYFSRRYDPLETDEINVYLHNGDDSAAVRGETDRSILVRVIGGNGTNTLADESVVGSRHHPARIYGNGRVEGITYGDDTLFNRRPWEMVDHELVPPRKDHGASFRPVVGIGSARHLGITPKLGLEWKQYGFARRPYAAMVKLTGDYAIKYGGARVTLDVDKRFESSNLHSMLYARMSEYEIVNFYGFGTDTPDAAPDSNHFEVRQRHWFLRPALGFSLGDHTDLSIGPLYRHSTTDSVPGRFITAERPYGFGTFDEGALQLSFQHEADAIDDFVRPALMFEANALHYPAMMDVTSSFQELNMRAGFAAKVPVFFSPLFVVRGGAKKLFGDFPFQNAAFLGGNSTTRYMNAQRYAGDASIFGTGELRVPLVRFHLVKDLKAGVIGLAEAGRVYVDGDSPGGWHYTTGGGIWIGLGYAPAVTITRTTEKDKAGVRVRLGLNF